MTDDEIDRLQIGSVVLFGKNKTPRVVRKVHFSHNERSSHYGRVGSVYFAIKKCSWTGRPYTIYSRSDLKGLCEFTGRVVDLPDIEKMIFKYETNSRIRPRICCCDVKGYA